MARINYVLIDYENVQAIDLERIKGVAVKVVFFVGKNQSTVPMGLFRKATEAPGVVEVVESLSSAKNAVDFQMACYAGQIAERDPEAFIHFVSKDKGFDVVVQYLKGVKRFSARAECFDALLFLNSKEPYAGYTMQERFDHVLGRLAKQSVVGRPRKSKTLLSSMNSMFGKQLPEAELKVILDKLVKERKIVISESQSITYKM